MDGDLAPLSDLASLAERYEATLYVDDAHGTGIMGPTGRGTIEQFGLEHRIPFHMGTLRKHWEPWSLHRWSNDMIQYLINVTRPFISQPHFHPPLRRQPRLQSPSFNVSPNVGRGSGRIDSGCSMECRRSVFV